MLYAAWMLGFVHGMVHCLEMPRWPHECTDHAAIPKADTSVWVTHQPILEQIFTFTDIRDMGSRDGRECGASPSGEWNQTPGGEK